MNDRLRVASRVDLAGTGLHLVGRGNVWVEETPGDPTSTRLTQWLMGQALLDTSPGQIELLVLDDDLTGVAAPFQALNNGGEKLLRTVEDIDSLREVLLHLRRHVHAVKTTIQGRTNSLLEFRRLLNFAVEGYKLVVVSADLSLLDDDTKGLLTLLLRQGPAAGVTFLLHGMSMDAPASMMRQCTVVEVEGGTVEVDGDRCPEPAPSAGVEELITIAANVSGALARTAAEPVRMDSVEDLLGGWGASSADGVTFVVGRYGSERVEITLGDELNQRHNALVTGAVGQGKSNLLSVMVHSLCARYSPAEIELYLLDFKEGITLQRLADDGAGNFLPHARVLGLDADREFALTLLRHLFAIYRSRMKLFRESGVQNLREYRKSFPDRTMPRLIVLVDEFQMMFAERDHVSDQIAAQLVKGVRLFRASGIHIVLASQTIGGNQALVGAEGEALFSQVPVRLALKNSLAESYATLGTLNDAAAHLRAREAIVNLDYGAIPANRKASISFADEELLRPLRAQWCERAGVEPPYVFDGSRRRYLSDDMRQLAHQQDGPRLALGGRVDIDRTPFSVSLEPTVGRNMALLCARDGGALLAAAATSVAVTSRGSAVELVVLDLYPDDPGWQAGVRDLRAAADAYGHALRLVAAADVPSEVSRLATEGLRAGHPTFVIGAGMDRCGEMPMKLQDLCKLGPVQDVHLLGWWSKYESFVEQVSYSGSAYFDIKVATQVDEGSVRQFLESPLQEWTNATNRALVQDNGNPGRPSLVIPYAGVSRLEED